jgi:hypothetical protein
MRRPAPGKLVVCALATTVMLACSALGQSPVPEVPSGGTAGQAASGNPAQPNDSSLPNAPSATLCPTPNPGAPGTPAQPQPKKVNLHPTLDEPFVPLTPHEKLHLWFDRTYSPYTFASILMAAGWAQATGAWPTYGGGMQGFGKRFGATLANTESSGFFKVFLLPAVLHQDSRYFEKRNGSFVARALYAATRVLFTRNDKNRPAFNTSEVVGDLFIHSLNNAYYPRRDRGLSQTFNGTLGSILSDAGSNILREFSPDLRRLFHKHEPARVKRLEERIPKSVQRITGWETQEETPPPEPSKPPEQNKESEQKKESRQD